MGSLSPFLMSVSSLALLCFGLLFYGWNDGGRPHSYRNLPSFHKENGGMENNFVASSSSSSSCSASSLSVSNLKKHMRMGGLTSDQVVAMQGEEKSNSRSSWMKEPPQHPMDPLTVAEILIVQTVLKESSRLGTANSNVLHYVVLELPEKEEVLAWLPGNPNLPRKAMVVMSVEGKPHKLIVDLKSKRVIEDQIVESSGRPPASFEELQLGLTLPHEDPRFLESIAARGLSLSDVLCLPLTGGWFGIPEEEGKRLLKFQCFDTNGTVNFYMRPVEGIAILIDLDSRQILSYYDRIKKPPVPKGEGTDYRLKVQQPPFVTPLNPISIEQPQGPSFKIEGHQVKWADWEFHIRPDPRAGMVISRVTLKDQTQQQQQQQDNKGHIQRSVLYEGFISEMFVPYQDPSEGWYFRTYFDAGEYGLGILALPLQPLDDCPAHAKYIDAVFAAPDGSPYVTPNMICVFERYAGDISWRHSEALLQNVQVII